MLLPLGLAYMLTGRFGPVMKVFFGYVSLVILAGLAVSGSRGGWLAVAASLPVVFFVMIRERQHRLPAIVALVVLLAGGVWFSLNSPYFKERQQATTTGGPERDLRLRIWPAAVEIWQENIWWGGGPAHFDHRFRAHRPETHVVQARPGHVHNDYLNTLADWGLVGALLVALPFLLLGWGIFRSWKFLRRSPKDFAKKRSNKSTFVLGAGTGLVAILVHSIFDFNLHLPANAILAVTLMALIACHFRFGSETHWIKAGWMLKAFTTLLLGAGIFISAPRAGGRRASSAVSARRRRGQRRRRPNWPHWKKPSPSNPKILRPPRPSANSSACRPPARPTPTPRRPATPSNGMRAPPSWTASTPTTRSAPA